MEDFAKNAHEIIHFIAIDHWLFFLILNALFVATGMYLQRIVDKCKANCGK